MQRQGAGDQHRRRREVAHDEFVALLGDLRRRRDVHDEGHAALLADLRDGDRLAGIEGADQDVATGVDRLLGLCARYVGLGLGVVIDDLELHGQLHVGEDVVCHVGAAAAGLADLGLQAGSWEKQADLEVGGRALGERLAQREGGAQQGGAGESSSSERSTAQATAGERVAAGHCGSSQGFLLAMTIEADCGAC